MKIVHDGKILSTLVDTRSLEELESGIYKNSTILRYLEPQVHERAQSAQDIDSDLKNGMHYIYYEHGRLNITRVTDAGIFTDWSSTPTVYFNPPVYDSSRRPINEHYGLKLDGANVFLKDICTDTKPNYINPDYDYYAFYTCYKKDFVQNPYHNAVEAVQVVAPNKQKALEKVACKIKGYYVREEGKWVPLPSILILKELPDVNDPDVALRTIYEVNDGESSDLYYLEELEDGTRTWMGLGKALIRKDENLLKAKLDSFYYYKNYKINPKKIDNTYADSTERAYNHGGIYISYDPKVTIGDNFVQREDHGTYVTAYYDDFVNSTGTNPWDNYSIMNYLVKVDKEEDYLYRDRFIVWFEEGSSGPNRHARIQSAKAGNYFSNTTPYLESDYVVKFVDFDFGGNRFWKEVCEGSGVKHIPNTSATNLKDNFLYITDDDDRIYSIGKRENLTNILQDVNAIKETPADYIKNNTRFSNVKDDRTLFRSTNKYNKQMWFNRIDYYYTCDRDTPAVWSYKPSEQASFSVAFTNDGDRWGYSPLTLTIEDGTGRSYIKNNIDRDEFDSWLSVEGSGDDIWVTLNLPHFETTFTTGVIEWAGQYIKIHGKKGDSRTGDQYLDCFIGELYSDGRLKGRPTWAARRSGDGSYVCGLDGWELEVSDTSVYEINNNKYEYLNKVPHLTKKQYDRIVDKPEGKLYVVDFNIAL